MARKKREPSTDSQIYSKNNCNRFSRNSLPEIKEIEIIGARKKYLVAIPTEDQPARIALWESLGDEEIAIWLVHTYELFKHLSFDWLEVDWIKALCQTVVTEI